MKTEALKLLQRKYSSKKSAIIVCNKLISISDSTIPNCYTIKFIHPCFKDQWQIAHLRNVSSDRSNFTYILPDGKTVVVDDKNVQETLPIVLDNMPNYALYQISGLVPIYETIENMLPSIDNYNKNELVIFKAENNIAEFTFTQFEAGTNKLIFSRSGMLKVIKGITFESSLNNTGNSFIKDDNFALNYAYECLMSIKQPKVKLLLKAMAPNSSYGKKINSMKDTYKELSYIEERDLKRFDPLND